MTVQTDYELINETSSQLAHKLFDRAFARHKTQILNAILAGDSAKAGKILASETQLYFKEAADRIQDSDNAN